MYVTVWIPAVLRRHAHGQEEVATRGATVGEALTQLGDRYAGLAWSELEASEMWPSLTILVNGDDVRGLQGHRTHVRDGDEISIIPAIAGGL